MPRDNREGRGGFIFIPQRNYESSWKVIITNEATSETWDITNDVINLGINWIIGRLSQCSLTVSNGLGKYLSKWDGGETIDVYAEYGDVDPSYKLFSGKIDNVFFGLSQNGYVANVECRQTPELADIKIVEQFDNVYVTTAIQQIVDTYYSGVITYTGLPTSTVRYTGNFRHTPGIKAIKELCEKAGFDVYIETNNNLTVFTKESVDNTDEAVSYETNLIAFPKYGKDRTKELNNVIVYGKEDSNIILLKTEADEASQADLWRKDDVITDNSLENMDEIQEFTDIRLADNINREEEGRVTALGMPKLKPGDNVVVNVPYCGASGNHNIRGLTQKFSAGGFLTTAQIKDIQQNESELFNDRINAEERLKPYSNLNNMTDSYTVLFNESPAVVTLSGCEIYTDSDKVYLKLSDGETSGVATSNSITADSNIVQCEFRAKVNFPNQELCTFEVSNNGGATWETTTLGTLHTFSSSGSQIRFRVNIIGDATHNPVFESLCLLYKVS
jgi:hypothetical protein